MAATDSDPEEAMTKEELHAAADEASSRANKPNNAFTKLMARKPKDASPPPPKPQISKSIKFNSRMGLGVYLEHPETFPASVVIYHNADFVVIRDKFPKAAVHTLILPRSAHHSMLHPFEALADAAFRAKAQAEVVKVKALVAKELQRRFGRDSRSEAARQAVLDGDVDAEAKAEVESSTQKTQDLPPGRDWAADVMDGVHTVPSMSHMHIHVLSRDMHSPSLHHRKHYNSFNTPFLVGVDEFPLAADDARRLPKEAAFLRRDLKCWRCGKNFGNQFKQLQRHLDREFVEWKQE